MEKIKFNNLTFYWLLIGYLLVLLIWNGYVIVSGKIVGVVPLIIQMTLLYLIFDKNKFARLGIRIWSFILILGPGLSLLGGLIKLFADEKMDYMKSITNLIILTTGLLILYFNKRTTEIVKIEK